MYYYQYRKNGGQVLGISLDDIWSDSTYIGVYSSETEYSLDSPLWCDGVSIREATQPEIDNFPIAREENDLSQKRQEAKAVLDGTDAYKTAMPRAIRAFVLLVLQEINTLRALHSLPEYSVEQMKNAIKNKVDEENGS